MSSMNKTLSPDCVCKIIGKIIVEPQNFTYNGPVRKYSGLGIFSGLQHREETQTDTGMKTQSFEICEYRFLTGVDLDEETITNLTLSNSQLHNFKTIASNSATEEAVQKFHSALQGKLEVASKGKITPAVVARIVEEMKSFNLGMVAKLQFCITKVSREKFPQSTFVESTQLYHRTVKSKQAYCPITTDIDAVVTEIKNKFKADRLEQHKSKDDKTFTYEVVESTNSRGQKRLVLRSEGADIYSSTRKPR